MPRPRPVTPAEVAAAVEQLRPHGPLARAAVGRANGIRPLVLRAALAELEGAAPASSPPPAPPVAPSQALPTAST